MKPIAPTWRAGFPVLLPGEPFSGRQRAAVQTADMAQHLTQATIFVAGAGAGLHWRECFQDASDALGRATSRESPEESLEMPPPRCFRAIRGRTHFLPPERAADWRPGSIKRGGHRRRRTSSEGAAGRIKCGGRPQPANTCAAWRWSAGSPAASTEPSDCMSSALPRQSVISPPAPVITGARAAKS